MDTIGIVGVFIALLAAVELGVHLPFTTHLESRSDRRVRWIYLILALVACSLAASITQTIIGSPYTLSIIVTLLIFYAIYHLAKRI